MAKETKVKDIDITKSGPMTFRQLQDANNDPFTAVRPQTISQYDINRQAPQMVSSSLAGTATPWGESMFDEPTATEAQFQELGDIRAENQPWYAQIGAGLAKGVVLAGTTFLNGTLGLVYGVGTAATEGKWSGLWDNDFSRAMDSLNKGAEEVLPNYYTQNELEQPWYTNIFTANFWGDKFIKNIGFTVGAFYSGDLYSKGLGAIMQAVKAGSKATSMVTSGVGSVISAVNEGSIEALNAANEFEEKYKTPLDNEFRQRVAAIQAEYDANAGKQLVRTGVEGTQFVDPAYVKYKEAIERERNNYNQALAKLEEDKAKVGNATLLMNIPILTASNFYQFGKLYSRGFNTARRTADVVGDIGKYEARGLSKAARAGRILGGGLSEGSEEVEQQIATDWSQHYYATDVNNYYRSLQDPDATQETLSWTKSFGETLGRTMGEGSTWEQFFIGGLTGLMGMPRFRGIRNEDGKLQSPVVLEENMFSKWKELKQEADRNQAIATHMNERVNSPEFKNYYQGFIRHNKYQNDMNDAALRDDEFDYKNAEHAQLISDISMFSNAGKLDDLMTLINSAYDTSDENLQSIIDNTTATINKDGKKVKVGPFMDKDGNPMGKEDMIAELTKQRDEILGTIDEYVKTRNKLDSETDQRFTDEQLDELTWMQTQLGNWAKRAGEMSDQVKDVVGNVIGRLESQMRAAEAIRAHEGMAHADLSENYRRADRVIQSITKAIDNLNLIRSLNNETMAATLAQNPNILEGLKEQVNKLDNDVLSANDKESVLKKLDDLLRLGNASKIYQDKFAEYLFNPKKQEEDHAEADKQNIDKDAKITRAKQVEALNKTANFQEVEALINNGEATLEDLDSSNSDAARSYKKASLFKKKATELINSSSSEHKSELLDMLNRRFNENATYDDLSDEALVTELPLEATTWDEKAQESLESEFNEILKSARDKVNSGSSQKQDVEAKKTGTKRPDNVGKDDVAQPPVDKPFSVNETINKIDKLNIAPEAKTEAKALANQIAKDIEQLSKSKDLKLIRQTQRSVNALSTIVGNDAIADIIDKVRELSKPDTFNPSSPEEVLREAETEMSKYKPTAVTGVLKAVVPQFDLDAKRDGVLIDFVGDDRNQGYSYVYNKLKEVDPKTGKNAFDYVNEGNVKEGDELEVRYEEANDEHPELLALYHKGTLVNYMNTDETIEGVKEIKDKAKKGEQPTVRVSKIMNGQYSYDMSKTQSVGDLLGTDNATIGVMKNRSMEANTDTFVEPVFDEANSDGKVYILLPNSKGTLSPKKVYIRHLNKTEFDLAAQNNPIANDLKKVFNDLAGLANLEKGFDEAVDNVYMDLIELLYIPDSFHINIISRANDISLQIAFADRDGKRQNRNILLKRFAKKSLLNIGAGTTQASEPYTAPVEEVYNQVLDAFYEANLAFNVDAKKLTDKKGQEYANRLRDSNVLATYLTSKRMQGTWFLLNEKPNTTHTDSAFERAKASQQAKGGIRVQYGGKEYFVRNGIIFDQSGSIVDLGDNAQQVKDLAYISSAYGTSYFGVNQHNGKVLIVDRNGKRGYNRATNKYLSPKEVEELEATLEGRKSKASQSATAVKSLQDSQKLVLRDDNGNPDTSNGSYMIKEEDGQYHKYQRVHSIIGSNYIGPSSGDAATSRGSIVDEVARQFLIDPTNVTKPEGMSDEAFGALKRGLGKFRDDANRRGLKLVTDRTVVFHKYSDDRRIAGELDVFAYNPSTGEISIFDFKTSKYSTKDTAFSKVTNSRYFTRSNKDQYALQLSAYAKLFEDSFGVPVAHLVIVPFQLRYSKEKDGGIARIVPEDYVPLTYQSGVFERTDDSQSGGQPTSLRTIKGQYVTTGKGKPEFHKVDLQVLFTTKNGQTFYLAKVGEGYKLILPNGRAMTIDPSLVSDEAGRTRNNIMDFIQADNVAAAIQGAMNSTPLENSPYGNSVVLDNRQPVQPQADNKIDNKEKLNKNEPKSIDERINIRSSLSGQGEFNIFGKEGSDVWKKSIDGRIEGRKNPDNVVFYKTFGKQQIALAVSKSSRGGAINITIWRDLTNSEKDTIRMLLMDIFIRKTIIMGFDKLAYTINDILHGNNPNNKPSTTPTSNGVDNKHIKRGLDALNRLNSLKPTTPTQQDPNQEAINKREKDEKATVAIDLSTPLGRSQLARKKWGEMTEAEKATISPMFEGMEEKDIQAYWDGTDATQREAFIPACK